MATDAQTLMTSAQCYLCASTGNYTLELYKLGLLKQLVLQNNPMADTSPQALMDAVKCYECAAASPYGLLLLELGLLQLVASGGGGGNAGQMVYYTGTDPNSDGIFPANTQLPAMAIKPNATTYTWDRTNQRWDV